MLSRDKKQDGLNRLVEKTFNLYNLYTKNEKIIRITQEVFLLP